MAKTTKTKISRTEHDDASVEAESTPAGTPTAPSEQEAPSANAASSAEQPDAKAVGDSQPRGGASFYIPPQKPSGFGVKEEV